MADSYTIFWFRRDLRLDDNAGLFHALQAGKTVIPLFIFDRHILDDLPEKDARVDFIHQCIEDLQGQLSDLGSSLLVKYGYPEEIWPELLQTYTVTAVYTNHDYEPYAQERDVALADYLKEQDILFQTFKDQVIFEKQEILTQQGKPYTVFTPYSRNWRKQLQPSHLSPYPSDQHLDDLIKAAPFPLPSLEEMGFKQSGIHFPHRIPDKEIIKYYDQKRDFPAIEGTTRVGIHLRFGTLSIRKLARVAQALNDTYLSELIWREFYMQILWNFPHVVDGPFRKQYGAIPWLNQDEDFEKWKQGQTGYPLVDAGMRQLNATGFMHNRVRMLVASFLSKHLLISWQWGEAYFAEKLLDYELASNNGGWQWAAGCGTDAAPYFRIFNPESQLKKFDPEGAYVKKWVPEYGSSSYATPMVDHKAARERCLQTYQEALNAVK